MIISKWGTTFKDYVGELAFALYAKKCNFNCPWCYNRGTLHEEHDAKDVIESWANMSSPYTAVVFLGGEPTVSEDLPELCQYCKENGKKVKIFTNGMRPDVIEKCMPFVDRIAMDVKETVNVSDRVGAQIPDDVYLYLLKETARIAGSKLEVRITFTSDDHRSRCSEFAKLICQPGNTFFQKQISLDKVSTSNLR